MSQLQTCAADCACNNAVLTSLNCVATDAGTQDSCFRSYPNGLSAVASMPAGEALGLCLLSKASGCGAMVVGDGGTDGGDAATTTDAATDAASDAAAKDAETTDAATDASDQ
jgi:hypothetical protein